MSTAIKARSSRAGKQDHDIERQARSAGPADHPVYRRGRHGAGHLARLGARARCGDREGLRGQAQDPLDGGLRRAEIERPLQHLAARRDRRGLPRVPGVDQGTAHDSDRRRNPLPERRAAPDARSLRLSAARALVQGRALARQGARQGGHGDLPREHRGHLRRDRVRSGFGRQPEVPGTLQAGVPEALRQDPLPRDLGL